MKNDVVEEASPSRASWIVVAWPTFCLVGWLAFELTAEPGIAIFVACLKCGWSDFLTAIWVRYRDPNRKRGRTICWVSLASSLLKVIGASILVSCIVVVSAIVIVASGLPPAKGLWPAAWRAMLIYPYVLPIYSIVMFIGCFTAWRNGLRIWLDSELKQARRRNSWPPNCAIPPRLNHADYMMSLMILGMTFVALAAAYFLWTTYDLLLTGIVIIVVTFAASYWLCRQAIAATPEQCWDALPSDPVQCCHHRSA